MKLALYPLGIHAEPKKALTISLVLDSLRISYWDFPCVRSTEKGLIGHRKTRGSLRLRGMRLAGERTVQVINKPPRASPIRSTILDDAAARPSVIKFGGGPCTVLLRPIVNGV